MYHSITIDSKNTWDDWRLVPVSRPVFNPPEYKSHLVSIPGRSIDIGTTPMFKDRAGQLTFLMTVPSEHTTEMFQRIRNYLNGTVRTLTLQDDPEHYYIGRVAVSQLQHRQTCSSVTLSYTLEPYRYSYSGGVESLQNWFWDDWDFNSLARIRDEFVVNPKVTDTYVITNSDGVRSLYVESAHPFGVEVNGVPHQIDAGITTIYNAISSGQNTIRFISETPLTFWY